MSKPGKNFVIVGAGAVGVSNALMLRHKLEGQAGQLDIAPEYTITLVDPRDYAGAGSTYWDSDAAADSHLYINNQPNERMVIDPQRRSAFSEYLAAANGHSPEQLATCFASRAAFGQYVNTELQNAVAQNSTSNVKLKVEQGKATDLQTNENGALTLVINDGENHITADAVINATGHQQNRLFNAFNETSGFFNSPTNIGELHNHLQRLNDNGLKKSVAIIGSGQSMIDAVAALDRGQAMAFYCDPRQPAPEIFERKIHVLSRSTLSFWPFIPEEHPPTLDDVAFEPKVLTAENISQRNAFTAEALKDMLKEEVESAKANPVVVNGQSQTFGPGQIYAKLDISKFETVFDTPEKRQALEEFKTHVKTLFGNPTPIQRFRLMSDVLRDGNAEFHLSGVEPESIAQRPDGTFDITLPNEDEPLHVGAIINAAACARSAFTDASDPETVFDPFLVKLHKKGLLRVNDQAPGFFAAGKQAIDGLYIARGPATDGQWGMERFSGGNEPLINDLVASHS